MSHDENRRDFLKTSALLGASAFITPTLTSTAKAQAPTHTGRMTFHGIDTHHGATIGTLRVEIRRFENGDYQTIKLFDTIKNGRSDGAVLEGDAFKAGLYEVVLHVGDYFAQTKTSLPSPSFLNKVPLRFGIAHPKERYHIAVLFSPWSYSYYRGS